MKFPMGAQSRVEAFQGNIKKLRSWLTVDRHDSTSNIPKWLWNLWRFLLKKRQSISSSPIYDSFQGYHLWLFPSGFNPPPNSSTQDALLEPQITINIKDSISFKEQLGVPTWYRADIGISHDGVGWDRVHPTISWLLTVRRPLQFGVLSFRWSPVDQKSRCDMKPQELWDKLPIIMGI